MDTCKDLTEYLAAYADGELEGELRERVRVHLDACERCRDECTELKKVANLYRESPPGEVSTGDWEKVAAALDAAMLDETPRGVSEGPHIETLRARAEKRRASKWWVFPVAALAAAVLLVAVLHCRSSARRPYHPSPRWSRSKPTPSSRPWSVCRPTRTIF